MRQLNYVSVCKLGHVTAQNEPVTFKVIIIQLPSVKWFSLTPSKHQPCNIVHLMSDLRDYLYNVGTYHCQLTLTEITRVWVCLFRHSSVKERYRTLVLTQCGNWKRTVCVEFGLTILWIVINEDIVTSNTENMNVENLLIFIFVWNYRNACI